MARKSVCRRAVHGCILWFNSRNHLYHYSVNSGVFVCTQKARKDKKRHAPLVAASQTTSMASHWFATGLYVTSPFKMLMFSYFVANSDFSFVHEHFIRVKRARHLLHATLLSCMCVATADIPESPRRMVQEKRHS